MYSQKLPSGKYRFFESYLDPMTMIRKTTSVTMDKDTRQSRKMAQELLSAKIRRFETISSDAQGITLRELLAAYKSGANAELRPQTVERNIREIKKAIEIIGPNIRADRLTARYITAKLNEWDAKNCTKNELVRRFSAFLRWAYKMDYIPSADFVSKLPHYADDVRARRCDKYLEPEELSAILDAMPMKVYKDMTLFAALSGMRVGEIIAIKTKNVDVKGRVIHVVESHSNITGLDGPTKTDGSTREIFIQDELMELINGIEPGKVYFFENDGEQVLYEAYRKYLRGKSEKAIGRVITPHYLRHTHTSMLASQGVPLDVISRRLGHADSRVTRDIYIHVTNAMKNRDNAILNRVRIV